jgi:P2-related tail formation protein
MSPSEVGLKALPPVTAARYVGRWRPDWFDPSKRYGALGGFRGKVRGGEMAVLVLVVVAIVGFLAMFR